MRYNVEKKNPAFTKITLPDCKAGWTQTFLITSDWHFDNPKCKQKLLFRHLDQAQEKEAGVFCFGDLFCAMQGNKDRRGSKSGIRHEHLGDNYFDLLVNDTAKKLDPYKKNLTLLSMGNHETAILKHNEINLLDRLVFTLNNTGEKANVSIGGYSGYIRFSFRAKGRSRWAKSILLKYHHGSGGASPVTKGAIAHQRAAVLYPSADIVVMGHIHQLQNNVYEQEIVDHVGNVKKRRQVHLRASTYKDAWADGTKGWEVEKGFGPSPLGGWWLTFYYENEEIKYSYSPTDW